MGRGKPSFTNSIYKMLRTGERTSYRSAMVIDWMLNLVGHETSSRDGGDWVMSSGHGQTFYPRLFETQTLEKNGIMRMSGGSGALRMSGEPYQTARFTREIFRAHQENSEGVPWQLAGQPVTGPRNIYQGFDVQWEITKGDGILHVVLVMTSSWAHLNPAMLLTGALRSLFVEHCPHDPDAELATPDPFATYETPFLPLGKNSMTLRGPHIPPRLVKDSKEARTVGVVAVHGNESQRMFSLVRGLPAVIQMDSCLQCCLNVCREANYLIVIDGPSSTKKVEEGCAGVSV